MRRVAFRAALLIACATLALPSVAEASSRRRSRRGANPAAPTGTPRSDETIQRIVADTPAGGTAHLPAGVYRTSIVVDRPIRLVAAIFGTTLDADGLGRPAVEVMPGVADVSIEGLRLVRAQGDGLLARGGNDRLLLSRVAVVGCQGDGARIAASDGVALDRCSFDSNAGDGLDVSGRGTRASRLSFSEGRAAAAILRGEDAALVDSLFVGGPLGVVLAGTRASASRCSFRGVALAARFDSASDTCAFTRNDVRACSTAASTDLGSIYDTISDNRVAGATADAIRLLGTWHTAEGNDLSSLGASGIVAAGDSFHIAGNRIDRPAGAGLVLLGHGCMVEENRLVAPAGAGLTVEGDGNVIALNDCASAGADAVVVTGAMNRVVGNTAEDAAGEGIRLAGDGNTLQDDVLVRTGGNGIHVASGSANRAEGNAITNCGGAGFLDEGVGTTLLRNRIN